ncbi:MAG: phosphoserine phosphatase SerB [Gammaproteobacteria bacterium]|nr:phosphoserine phosphatase SerB [Gammaproteobacteria bacterium]
MHKIILQGAPLTQAQISQTLADIEVSSFSQRSAVTTFCVEKLPTKETIQSWREILSCDVNVLPEGFDPSTVKLVVSDMDSTLINIECVDEIADFAGVKDKVSEVTEAAMRGELDFAESLVARVKLLAGLDVSALQKVYDERLKLNPGAEEMLAALKANDIKFALVSGGFTFFTDRLKSRLALDYTLSNTLERDGDLLTGRVTGEIIGGEAKAAFLLEKCEELGILPSQAVAIGDGANDLLMMAEAGLGVAYYAKPKVQSEADCALNYTGLEGLTGLLGLAE